jgi:molybdenum cofactor biosynthesis enzyme MoaA
MTTPDIAGLCKRLRDNWDWPSLLMTEAADTLERQAAEIKRLRANLERVTDHLETWVRDHIEEATTETRAAIYCARAALTGEDR